MQFSHKPGMKRPLIVLLGGMALMLLVLGLGLGGGGLALAKLGQAEELLLLMLGASVVIAVLGFRNWRPYTV